MRLADYLPTRVVELGLHTLDLQAATGQPLTLPASATNVMLGVLAELADLPVLLLAITGRRALPDGFNVIASQRERAPPVPPFHAMEMARRATEREATGASVIHLEVGQPSAPAPAAVREAAEQALERDTIGYTNAPGLLSLRRGDRPPLRRLVRGRRRPGAHRRDRGRVGRLHPGLPGLLRTGPAGGRGRARLPLLPQHAAGARRRAGRHPRRSRHPVGADPRGGRRPRGRSTAWWWPARRTPPAPCCRPSASPPSSTWCRSARRAARVRRDLPRHLLRAAGRDRAGARRATPWS